MDDPISRQAAIAVADYTDCTGLAIEDVKKVTDEVVKGLKQLPSSQADQHGRVFKEIVVKYPTYSTYPEYEGKPYFSIKYTENGQEFIGYGTYNPEALSKYLKEYFLSSAQSEVLACGSGELNAQPDIIRCKDCKYCTEHYDTDGNVPYWSCSEWDSGTDADGFCYMAERRTDEHID